MGFGHFGFFFPQHRRGVPLMEELFSALLPRGPIICWHKSKSVASGMSEDFVAVTVACKYAVLNASFHASADLTPQPLPKITPNKSNHALMVFFLNGQIKSPTRVLEQGLVQRNHNLGLQASPKRITWASKPPPKTESRHLSS